MKHLSALFLLVAMAIPATAQDAPQIRFPVIVQPVAPIVPVNPAIPVKLTANVFYVVEADVPCIVTSSPLGLVKIVEEAGPIRARGVFVDGNGQTETRQFKGKQVFFVEADGKGLTELLVIPIGAKDVADIHRKMIDVGGVGPRPPPDVVPDAEPTDELYKSLKNAWLAESASSKAARADLAAIYSQSVPIAKTDKTLTTAKQLFEKMHAARLALVKDNLPAVRAVLTTYLDANLPRSVTAPLDDVTRDKAAACFDLISKHLMRLP